MERISSVSEIQVDDLIMADPNNGKPVGNVAAAQTKIICHTGDNICAGGSTILAPHLTYSQNATDAAAFVMKSVAAA